MAPICIEHSIEMGISNTNILDIEFREQDVHIEHLLLLSEEFDGGSHFFECTYITMKSS